MIKVIVFDYAGVITPGPLTQWTKENLNPTDDKYKLYKNSGKKWDMGEMVSEEVFNVLSEVTGISANEIWEKIYLKPKLNQELKDLIIYLKRDYKIILFSNFIGNFLRKLLEKDNITNLFDEIIVSSDYGLRKPDPKFYKLLVEKSGANIDEVLFTDDSLENVDAANKFGIKSFVFTNTENFIKDLKKIGIKID